MIDIITSRPLGVTSLVERVLEGWIPKLKEKALAFTLPHEQHQPVEKDCTILNSNIGTEIKGVLKLLDFYRNK